MVARQHWVKGRSSRADDTVDPLAPLELLSMASTAAGFAAGQSLESIFFLTGVSSSTLTMLVPLVQPRQAWIDIHLLSAGPNLSGEDLTELERIFIRVERAMVRASAKDLRTIRAFSTALAGPVAPKDGFSDSAIEGARRLFAIARLGQVRLAPAPLGRSGLNALTLADDKGKAVKLCWLEATSLGLLKARLRYVMNAPRDHISSIDAPIE